MLKISPIIWIILMSLAGCASHTPRESVQIYGENPLGHDIVVVGMGTYIDEQCILTSAHGVYDSTLAYRIGDIHYQVTARDVPHDRAVLCPLGIHSSDNLLRQISGYPQRQIGESVSTRVFRSGSLVTLTGRITDPHAHITGYHADGTLVSLSGIILTDIDLQPGDSGAPLIDLSGEIIDVVHVR